MLLPTLWLEDYVDAGLDPKALADRLTMTGTYVERLYAHGVTALEYFVVGRVLSAERHPDADRLTVCMVALGEGDTAQIVCGAPNVAEGQTVAVARPGAVIVQLGLGGSQRSEHPVGAELGPDRAMEPFNLAGRSRRPRLGQQMFDAVLPADPVKQRLHRRPVEPAGEHLAVVGQDLLRAPIAAQRCRQGRAYLA